MASKLHRYPEGTYTEAEWVKRFADRVESYTVDHMSLLDRAKYNRLDGQAQDTYIASLKAKAAKPRYRAWRGDVCYEITAATYKLSEAT